MLSLSLIRSTFFCINYVNQLTLRAGVGRTGTLLAYELCTKADYTPVDAVDYMRTYRPAMVQNELQWRFLLDLLEAKFSEESF